MRMQYIFLSTNDLKEFGEWIYILTVATYKVLFYFIFKAFINVNVIAYFSTQNNSVFTYLF